MLDELEDEHKKKTTFPNSSAWQRMSLSGHFTVRVPKGGSEDETLVHLLERTLRRNSGECSCYSSAVMIVPVMANLVIYQFLRSCLRWKSTSIQHTSSQRTSDLMLGAERFAKGEGHCL